ncbi:MAG: glycerol-3-phosphate 1-O-acyltransferase PlsY [Acidimicrobiia bacterium]|nr:glycerol-3-phosphate 1-O-acyltransferase PlsY [Acidimicrobiia bacterium]
MGAGTGLLALSYLLGTFPTALIVARLAGHDPTKEGSGNPGASNVYRLAGTAAGLAVFIGDAAKGAAAAGMGRAAGGPALALACGMAAVLGHVFPVFRGFRGGRGVATAAGTVAVLEPAVAVPFVAAWLLVARLTGKASVASLVVIGATPVVVLALDRPAWEKVGVAALAAVVVGRHAGNLTRLVRGDEPTLQPGETSPHREAPPR